MSLDDILVDVAIDDERGRAFWKSNFLNEVFIHIYLLIYFYLFYFIILVLTKEPFS